MRCPYCGELELRVIDSRNATESNAIRRRRECQKCHERFTSFETVELLTQVRKRDGSYEEFNQNKLIAGISAACHHTSISQQEVVQIASEIVNDLVSSRSEITTREIGDRAMEALQKRDPIAYIRFACVYRRLKNVAELMHTIEAIQPKDGE